MHGGEGGLFAQRFSLRLPAAGRSNGYVCNLVSYFRPAWGYELFPMYIPYTTSSPSKHYSHVPERGREGAGIFFFFLSLIDIVRRVAHTCYVGPVSMSTRLERNRVMGREREREKRMNERTNVHIMQPQPTPPLLPGAFKSG